MDTTWKVANIRIRPVTRMKQIDATSQPLEHGYKKLVFKRNSRMRLHQKIWGRGQLCFYRETQSILKMKINRKNSVQRLAFGSCLSKGNVPYEQIVNNS